MKTIVLKPVVNFEGRPIRPPREEGKPPGPVLTLKTVFVNCLGSMRAQDGEQAIKAWDCGLKVHGANVNGALELEDAEFELLELAITQNPTNYVAVVIGQAQRVINTAKETAAKARKGKT